MIRTLLSVPGQRLELHDGSETSAEAFRRDPESLCSRVTWEDQEERIKWIYMVSIPLHFESVVKPCHICLGVFCGPSFYGWPGFRFRRGALYNSLASVNPATPFLQTLRSHARPHPSQILVRTNPQRRLLPLAQFAMVTTLQGM